MARGWRSLLSSPGWPIAVGKRAARWCSGRTGGRCCSVGRKSTACRRNHEGLGVSNASTVLKSPVDCGRDVARGWQQGRSSREGWVLGVGVVARCWEDATVGTGEGKVQGESGGCKSLSAGRNLQVLSQFQRREKSTVRVAYDRTLVAGWGSSGW